ncbi:hypothetical protein FACS1894125_0850 [Actinomycetota bacterium]|nr:hypothetical protein FACS1894125_0850 [Actinomycetota bacterium]
MEKAPVINGLNYIAPLGSGGFTDVYQYQQSNPSRQVAVKVLKKEHLNSSKEADFFAESDLMAKCAQHPNVLNIFGTSIAQDGRPYIMIEKCSTTYDRYLNGQTISVQDLLDMAILIASALEYVNQLGFLHRDIKPSNIMINDFNRPVLADFSVSCNIADVNKKTPSISMGWTAPEVLAKTSNGSIQSDIYSFGMSLYSMLAGQNPFETMLFEGINSSKLARAMDSWKYQPLSRTDIPPNLQLILEQLLKPVPQNRPKSFLEVASALQQVQMEMRIPPTRIDLVTNGTSSDFSSDTLQTRIARTTVATKTTRTRTTRTAQNSQSMSSSNNSKLLIAVGVMAVVIVLLFIVVLLK